MVIMTENLLKEEGRPLSERDSMVSTAGVISSEIWQRMKRAEKVMVEVPFSLASNDGERPRIISGTIDLIFREKDRWVIADYKTGEVDSNLEALTAYHKPQVEMYRKFWEEILGEKVKEAGLYFSDSGKWVTLREECLNKMSVKRSRGTIQDCRLCQTEV